MVSMAGGWFVIVFIISVMLTLQVMDRLCLVVFVLFTTILSLAVFISAPKVIVY